ncbi:MAG: hypothetical protein KF718_01065 [Polyangiaceae bacterium]|nr:hypothetical protein [Polyangiaceae bacterium]
MRHVLVLLGMLALVGCGQDEGLAEEYEVPFEPAAEGTATPFGDIPWPSDLYLSAAGTVGSVPGIARVASNETTLQRGLSELDGFGRSTGAVFFVGDSVDPATLPRAWDDAVGEHPSVLIVDVDPDSPKRGVRYPAIAKAQPTFGSVAVIPVPGVVLPPGVRHAAVLTSRVRTTSGRSLRAAPALRAIATLTTAERSTRVEKLYGDALDALVATGGVTSASEVASLAVFTTSRRVYELPALRNELRKLAAPSLIVDPDAAKPYTVAVFGRSESPTLTEWLGTPETDEAAAQWPGGDNPGGIAHDQIGVVLSAAFVAPSYLDAQSKHFERDGGDKYLLANPTATIPVTLVLPAAPPPPSGYPVVINGHGLSNDRGSMLSTANELARAGFAVIGIDDVLHGARGGIVDTKNNYKGSFQGPDGIPDEKPLPVAFFAAFGDFVIVRDNFRQTILDQVSLVRLIENPKLDLTFLAEHTGGVVPKLDPSRIYWSGGSLGGIMGTMTAAVEPHIRGFALHVPGAAFVQLITTQSAKVAPLVTSIAKGTFGIVGDDDDLDEFHPVALLLGAITEAGDPAAYAPHVLLEPFAGHAPPDVLVTYAAHDEVLPNAATIALVRALGLERAGPHFIPMPGVLDVAAPASANIAGRTGVAVEYGPANHALGYARWDLREFIKDLPQPGDDRFPLLPAPFTFELPVREHCVQLVTFLTTAAQGPARVIVTAPARQDFDADGVTDDVEVESGTDPEDPNSH